VITSFLALALVALPSPGTPAPDFTAKDQAGHRVTLSKLRGQVVVLYFYPKDQTPGCTVEARGFRDTQEQYAKVGAIVLGVSGQDYKSHEAFAESENLGFSLLDDHAHKIAAAYGVGSIPVLGLYDRVTLLIDRDGVVQKVWPNVSPKGHAAEVLEAIRALPAAPPPKAP
jgi:thioredoxin-dependent peroxiredoxin